MNALRWNPLKNEGLRLTRGITFDELTQSGSCLT